jgi:hypothetical protein
MKYAPNIREEELKNRIAADYFADYDTVQIVGNIDFAVAYKQNGTELFEPQYLLWAEAKQKPTDAGDMFAQLMLTIGKQNLNADKMVLPPVYLGVFDCEKIAFVPYSDIVDIFSINDFNWKVRASNDASREFGIIKERVQSVIKRDSTCFYFDKDSEALRVFIHDKVGAANLAGGKIQINRNNFINIYFRWLEEVKPLIDFNWEAGKKAGIIDADFYRADLFVDDKDTDRIDDDVPVLENLMVVWRSMHYTISTDTLNALYPEPACIKFGGSLNFGFKSDDDKYKFEQFWKKYKRPPLSEFHQYIIDRRDLLKPQNLREYTGAFYTPPLVVARSQDYLAAEFGNNWQDEYYVWDCAAGSGNLLVGLAEPYRLWASTLEQPDVNTMYERIEGGLNLLKDHCFQFDFLNDGKDKLPQGLRDIIEDVEKQKKLIIYINPPYGEAATKRTSAGTGQNKPGVSTKHQTYLDYKQLVGAAAQEKFAQFFTRIYDWMPNCKLASITHLKYVNSPNFDKFREYFKAKYLRGFIFDDSMHDNANGKFPTGFLIWDLAAKKKIKQITCDVVDKQGNVFAKKNFYAPSKPSIGRWIATFDGKKERIGEMIYSRGGKHENSSIVRIENNVEKTSHNVLQIDADNLIPVCVYFAVRWCIPHTWINDADQYFYPKKEWEKDTDFQRNCLIYTLFHDNNKPRSAHGANHWIPFTEKEVAARDCFASNFMSKYIAEIKKPFVNENGEVIEGFSAPAQAVYEAGLALWRYYHEKIKSDKNGDLNASLYDIKAYFNGRSQGRMNSKSADEQFNQLLQNLRAAERNLAREIEPKVYEYEFLMG